MGNQALRLHDAMLIPDVGVQSPLHRKYAYNLRNNFLFFKDSFFQGYFRLLQIV